MVELIPEECIVDYLSLCFGINASIAFDRIQNVFRKGVLRVQEMGFAELTAIGSDLGRKRLLADGVNLKIKKVRKNFDDWMDGSRRRGGVYSLFGCAVCFAGILLSGYPYVRGGHALNLLYLFPVVLFSADVFLGWSICRILLWWHVHRLRRYQVLRTTLQKMEDNLLEDIPRLETPQDDKGPLT